MQRHPLLVAAILILMAHQKLAGCFCAYPPSFCTTPPQVAAPDAAIFVGTVVESSTPRVWRLRVTEWFQGSGNQEFVVHTGFTMCDPRFQIGKSYLVVAHKSNLAEYPGWVTSPCLRTGEASQLVPEIHSLRAWKAGTSPTKILYGTIIDSTPAAYKLGASPKEMSGVKVSLRGSKGTREAITDASGKFIMPMLEGDDVVLGADIKPAPARMITGLGRLQAHTKGACSSVGINVTERQEIRGTIQWKPIPNPMVFGEVQSAATGQRAGGGAVPGFSVRNIPPGKYVVAVRIVRSSKYPGELLYYPGVRERARARVFEVRRGQVTLMPTWVLPKVL